MGLRTLHDIFRCPYCSSIAARGNSFCRGCGVKFKASDINTMEKNIHHPIGATPWNTRDRYRCLHCAEFVSIKDKYCRGCGDEIEHDEKHLMKLKMSELAKKNTPSLIGLMIFVLMAIWATISLV